MRPYPLAWSIVPHALVRKERWPGSHKMTGVPVPLVSPGQDVVPDQPILRWQDTYAVTAGLSRLSASSLPLPSTPSPAVVPAGLYGRVVEITKRGGVIIESRVTLVQGVIGAGEQVAGPLTLWNPQRPSNRQPIPPGAILIIPNPLNFTLLRQIVASGVAGIVSSSIALKDLEGFLHTDLIAFLQEERTEQRMLLQQHFPRLTLLFTEGLAHSPRGDGDLPLPTMPTNLFNALSHYQGSVALLSGETSFRNGIIPELLISQPPNSSNNPSPVVQPDTSLIPGAQVRIYGGELQGITGTIDYLFAYKQRFPSGLHARAARLRLEDGTFLIVPLFSLERIG